ncbi:MAG TPA: hypothetical protein DHW82_04105 [Spirochaetia bacterium]|nr:MAG: hypothetical protein A2Y41_11225 [Spirochaetes bacterium GWB1_36_13]HCL56176.1 hypothetical protein [Spirochaetia bacterium]
MKYKVIMEIKKLILPLLIQFQVKKAGIFGSFARNEEKDQSDLDLLIEIDSQKSLFEIIDLKIKLEEKIGRKVDLVEYDCINPMLKEKILNEEMRIL